jgi:large subunit ribosomal protein L43
MATRGVFQLQKLVLTYCEHGGSSRAVRDVISSGQLSQWAVEHPHVQIHVQVRNGRHPFVEGSYVNRAKHQVGVKNRTTNDVLSVCDLLHNRSGRKIKKVTVPVVTATPSVQGVWTPFLDLASTRFPVTIVESDESNQQTRTSS